MKKNKYFVVIMLLCSWSFTSFTFAQSVNKVGTSGATFLRIPVGAQAIGMGSAYVSMMNDPSALFWNPAATASIKENTLLVDHALWLPGIYFDFIGITIPLADFGTTGLSLGIMHTNDMEITTPDQPMGTGEMFNASSFVVGVSYSRNLTDRFSIGGTFKYIRETIYNDYASAIGFDVGTLFQTPFAGIRLGASISNFGTKIQMTGEDLFIPAVISNQQGTNQSITARLNTDAFDLPLIMRVGISDEIIKNDDVRVTVAMDGVSPNDNAQSVNLGCELGFLKDKFQVRGGYKDLFLPNNEATFTFGTSIHEIDLIGGVLITFDYAYQNFIHLGSSNRFTLQLKI
ncbi:MAG: hypothetical protein COZ80_03140 [Ignavibacteria bacterium CG_4_8_14_3_um_filter_37_9]|nr:MAG: hypothetical protein AUJ54_08805 [Ignavibacteria bacterium CG1_02_37_35]PIS46324.1 MAG: hypothetical protein COT22_00585 [Ignavibacteria bacterium CG08_land_8_20_14_0_20_37_9]PIW99870.1 MAG: hypothetical protein COZ80_03140 [Ignavibacteria bacterium CG_4_8_14_3_um_filter_37_9]PJC58271.1 MAG: hypothetical protein CO025_09720 [Ignavibacteria bacterium CG_4_9_14_0_2_um_filter_37_13]